MSDTMSDSTPQNSPPSGSVGNAPPRKKSGLGCLGILAIVAGLFAVLLIIGGILVWQSMNWFKNAPEPTIAVGEPLNLSNQERSTINDIITDIESAKSNKKTIDVVLAPRVLNGVIERIIEEQAVKQANENNPKDLIALRVNPVGNGIRLNMTLPARDQQTHAIRPGLYYNLEADGELEIVEGEILKFEIRRITLGGQEPPFLARRFISSWIEGLKNASLNAKNDPQHTDNDLRVIKLLRREGDLFHLVLEGSLFKD